MIVIKLEKKRIDDMVRFLRVRQIKYQKLEGTKVDLILEYDASGAFQLGSDYQKFLNKQRQVQYFKQTLKKKQNDTRQNQEAIPQTNV